MLDMVYLISIIGTDNFIKVKENWPESIGSEVQLSNLLSKLYCEVLCREDIQVLVSQIQTMTWLVHSTPHNDGFVVIVTRNIPLIIVGVLVVEVHILIVKCIVAQVNVLYVLFIIWSLYHIVVNGPYNIKVLQLIQLWNTIPCFDKTTMSAYAYTLINILTDKIPEVQHMKTDSACIANKKKKEKKTKRERNRLHVWVQTLSFLLCVPCHVQPCGQCTLILAIYISLALHLKAGRTGDERVFSPINQSLQCEVAKFSENYFMMVWYKWQKKWKENHHYLYKALGPIFSLELEECLPIYGCLSNCNRA